MTAGSGNYVTVDRSTAGMADDQAMLKLLAAVDVAGAKAVVIGDHLQLGAVEPGGGLEALVNRHGPAVHVLDENIRQRDPGERAALAQLRSGDVGEAVDWYRRNDRIVNSPIRNDALEAAVDAWEHDLLAGKETVLLAWRRRDVAALNDRARQRRVAAGAITGPEIEAPGGRRYAAGDLVVALAPSGEGRFVTSERGTVTAVGSDQMTVRFADGRDEVLIGDQLDGDHLDHAYALTVHRVQGATVDTAHVFADGGGRELAYVAMSRARARTHVYVTADDHEQATEDLVAEWSLDRRQRWTIDVDRPAEPGQPTRPDLARRATHAVRLAQLVAERDAVEAVAPDADVRLAALNARLRLERATQRPAQARALTLG